MELFQQITEFLHAGIRWYNEYVGGYLIVALLIPVGVFFAFKFKFLHITKLRHAFRVIGGKYDKDKDLGDINHFRALTTALSATVGTGNIVGVALAIQWGGPGAIFWMWVVAFFGMMLKFVESTLGLKYRKTNQDGSVSGGPMYYIEYGLKKKLGKFAKVLAVIFAVAAVICSFGTGNMAQSNSISDALFTSYGFDTVYTGLIVTMLVLLVIIGGIKRIASVTSKLVPFMAVFYVLTALVIIGVMYKEIPHAFSMIFSDAFTGTAATGGFAGSAFILTLKFGVQRGLFSNEAGQGSAPIAHAAAKTEYPVREGLVASVGPLIDTLIICTITALVILVTGAWTTGAEGVAITIDSFRIGLEPIGLGLVSRHLISLGLLLFAFSTIISWSYYGSRAVQYLFGDKAIKPYYWVFGAFVFLGSIWGLDIVWDFVDMVITFMTIPNLIGIVLLAPVVKREIDKYFKAMKETKTLY
ncbi:MAG TPA: sodium:alanine symporter family protein [Bacteroidales bacterium]|nr:sodium:alanine symporter family protein [Bacteroidales bacterium]